MSDQGLKDCELASSDPNTTATVSLLGRFTVVVGGCECRGFEGRRVQELLTYLIVNHDRPVRRELLADQLWGDGRGERRKQLRHALWQLQTAMDRVGDEPVIDVDHDWVRFVPGPSISVDVLVIEHAQGCAHGRGGAELSPPEADVLQRAVSSYRGDLLPSCYEDWCVIERERYRTIYLSLLDKLMAHAEASGHYEDGLAFGELVLHHDPASERTHRRLMRIRYLNGDRTGALRQFDMCARALRDELDVDPAPSTVKVSELIRLARPLRADDSPPVAAVPVDGRERAVDLLRQLRNILAVASERAIEALRALESDRSG
jgi:DNA-binding SARP family transcriptional activator